MLEMLCNIRYLAGKDFKKMIWTVLLAIADSFFNAGMYVVMLFLLLDLSGGVFSAALLRHYILLLAGLFVLRCVVQGIALTKVQYDGPVVSKKLRLRLGNHIRSLNLGFFNKTSQGQLNAILTTDINDVETILTHCVCDLSKITAFTFYGLAMAFILDWRYGLVLTIVVLVALPLLGISGNRATGHSKESRTASQELVSRLVEYISGMRTFRLYRLAGSRFQRLDYALKQVRQNSIKSELSLLPLTLSFSAVTSMIIPIALLFGSWLLTTQGGEPMTFLCVLLLSVSLSGMLATLSSLYPQVRSLNAAAAHIRKVLEEKPLPYKREHADLSGRDIAFNNVDFSYTGKQQVLNQVSFCVKYGTTTALIGPSGSGKTTVVSLLSRFWDVTGGKITIGGLDIREWSPDALTSQMAVVLQDVYLLNDTVINNIRIGRPDAAMEEVVSAAIAAHCHDFIMEMEQGYQTVIGEGGSTLSGGERQRISIARALLKDAPIILLDETTSSLDADNEREIQKAFNRLMEDKTVLVIAHRLNTIEKADQILVMDGGTIREAGSHQQLMEQNGWYAHAVREQYKAQEWAAGKLH
ncbi:MAG: ABC transporter ATP-binding protein [Lachnospiraceae bacterium]